MKVQKFLNALRPKIISYLLLVLVAQWSFISSSHLQAQLNTSQEVFPTIGLNSLYALEEIDCIHRHGSTLHNYLLMFNKISNMVSPERRKTMDFWKWLDSKELQGHDKIINIPRVHYMDSEERKLHAINIYKGRLQLSPEQEKFVNLSNPNGVMYVMDENGQFYFRTKDTGNRIENREAYHHSSFFAGKPVAGAGQMYFNENRKLVYITNFSGHYTPSDKEMINVLLALHMNRVKLRSIGIDLLEIQDFYKKHGINIDKGDSLSAFEWLIKSLHDHKN